MTGGEEPGEIIVYDSVSGYFEVTPRQLDTAITFFLPNSVNGLRGLLAAQVLSACLPEADNVSSLLVMAAFYLTCDRCGRLKQDQNPVQACQCPSGQV